MGPDRASTVLSMLPPSGWSDVATKPDLVDLERRLDLRVDGLEQRMDRFEQRMDRLEHRLDDLNGAIERQTTRYIRWLFLANGAFLAAVAAGASLATTLA